MRVGVLLAGCGVQDGSEVYEAVLSILALERAGASVQAMAPDVDQSNVVNHYVGDEARSADDAGGAGFLGLGRHNSTRSVLAESARIVRGKIISTHEVSSHELDALIIPGGYGVVKNLCTYAADGLHAKANPDCERLIQEMNGLGKPIGAICIAPVLVALALRNVGKGAEMTVGNDSDAADFIHRSGSRHHVTGVDEIHVDPEQKIVSTPAFMLAHSPAEVAPAIEALVTRVLQMARENGPGHSGDLATSHEVTSHN